jgi:hypothetical protein
MNRPVLFYSGSEGRATMQIGLRLGMDFPVAGLDPAGDRSCTNLNRRLCPAVNKLLVKPSK